MYYLKNALRYISIALIGVFLIIIFITQRPVEAARVAAAKPEIIRLPYASGFLVRDSGVVYLIRGNLKLPFANATVFRRLGYSPKAVINADLADYNLGTEAITTAKRPHPVGSWIRNNKKIYYIHEAGLLLVPNLNIFSQNGGRLALIAPANSYDLKNLKIKPTPLALQTHDARVYVFKEKPPIPAPTTAFFTPFSPITASILPVAIPTPVAPAPVISTNGWDKEKAEHLARRVLLAPTQSDIDRLVAAGTAEAAITILFTPPSPNDLANWQQNIATLVSKRPQYNSEDEFNKTLYSYKLINDPYRAKRKLFYLWENIFSVDGPNPDKKIDLADVIALHNTIYDATFENYLNLVEKVRGNYAMAQYLDLTDSPADGPNENFAREFLMLFLMGESSPTHPNVKNYSDADVNALAHILTGYTANSNATHTIAYDSSKHFTDNVNFLGENTNDPQQVISFLVKKRKQEMAEFLANKLLKFYVNDRPSLGEIQSVAEIVKNNNFETLTIIKTLLASAIMYDQKNINEVRVKNPLEIMAGYYASSLGDKMSTVIPEPYDLDVLNFIPYNPGSIFGRAGFVNNRNFLTDTVLNKWMLYSNSLSYRDPIQKIVLAQLQKNSNALLSPDALIDYLQSNILLSRKLQTPAREQIKQFLTTDENGGLLTFNMSDADYVASKLPGLLALIYTQPEFVLQSPSTYTSYAVNQERLPKDSAQAPKLVIIKMDGGFDFQGLVANTRDPKYAEFRGTFALGPQNSTVLANGYAISSIGQSLLPLLNKKQAVLLNAVGLPDQSRGHDIASEQVDTGMSGEGIIGRLYKNNQSQTALVSLSNKEPALFRGGDSLQIGDLDLRLMDAANPDNKALVRQLELFKKGIFASTLPAQLAPVYSDALLLDKLSQELLNKNSASLDYDNKNQLNYITRLMDNGIGSLYYLFSDKGFDAHEDNERFLQTQGKELIEQLTGYFNKIKDTHKITIIAYSEFGRTNRINGSGGTDHGQGGGMIVLSNQLAWPTMVGTINPSKDENDWTTVQVDLRDVWSTLLRDVYAVPIEKLFDRKTSIFDYPRP